LAAGRKDSVSMSKCCALLLDVFARLALINALRNLAVILRL